MLKLMRAKEAPAPMDRGWRSIEEMVEARGVEPLSEQVMFIYVQVRPQGLIFQETNFL
jgi:hypothetical protein